MAVKVFISYRREDSKGEARALKQALEKRLPGVDVFMDVDNGIKPGASYIQVLDQRVAEADVMLALIGPRWLEAVDENGARRLDSPADPVRIEIYGALKRLKSLIPVLIDHTRMPGEAELPEAIRLLHWRQSARLRDDRFDADVDAIAAEITKSVVKAAVAPPPPRRSRAVAFGALLAGLAVGATAGAAAVKMFAGEQDTIRSLRKNLLDTEVDHKREKLRIQGLYEAKANEVDELKKHEHQIVARLRSELKSAQDKAADTDRQFTKQLADAKAEITLLGRTVESERAKSRRLQAEVIALAGQFAELKDKPSSVQGPLPAIDRRTIEPEVFVHGFGGMDARDFCESVSPVIILGDPIELTQVEDCVAGRSRATCASEDETRFRQFANLLRLCGLTLRSTHTCSRTLQGLPEFKEGTKVDAVAVSIVRRAYDCIRRERR